MVRFETAVEDGELRLVPFRPDDRAALLAGRDEVTERYLGVVSSEPSPSASVWVGPDMVGWIDFDTGRPWLEERQVNVGYAIFPGHRGKHHATRALRLMVEFLDGRDPPLEPTLLIDPDNRASLAVAAGVGFENVGSIDGQLLFVRPAGSRPT